MTNTKELLPCPFCGSDEIECGGDDKTREDFDFAENLLRDACMRIDAGYGVDIRVEAIKIVRLIRNHDFMGKGNV